VLLFPFGWESHVDRTHSVLVTTLAAGTLWTYFALLRHPTRLRRALFGLLIGLGMQSKYNFAVFALGLAAASLIVRQHRSVIWTRDMWITVQVAALSLLPHASWFAQQVDTASGPTLGKMHSGAAGYGANLINSLGDLVISIVAFISGFWIVLGFLFWPKRRGTLRLDSPEARFFFWLHAAGLGFIVALILCGCLVNIRARWLQPLLFSLPLGFFVFFLANTAKTYRQVLLIALLGGLAMTVTLALRPQLQAALGKRPRIHQPYPELAAEIMRRFPTVQAIAGEDLNVAGNVHFQLQRIPALLVEDLCGALPAIGGKVLVLVQDGSQAATRPWRTCPGAVIVERGKIGARFASHPRNRLLFDYTLLQAVPNATTRQ